MTAPTCGTRFIVAWVKQDSSQAAISRSSIGMADNEVQRLPALAADLVNRRVAVIAATGGGASVQAAKGASTTIPIVFVSAGDPVKEGYVASLYRPGGNLTGITWFGTLLSGKGFGLLHELVPNAALIALLVNPNTPESAHTPQDLLETTRT